MLTEQGPRQVYELLGLCSTLVVDSACCQTTAAGFYATGSRNILKLVTKEGYSVRLTENQYVLRAFDFDTRNHKHQWQWVEVIELNIGDRISINNHLHILAWPGPQGKEEGYFLGLMLDDGCLSEELGLLEVWFRPIIPGVEPKKTSQMKLVLKYAKTLPHSAQFRAGASFQAHTVFA